MAVANAIPMIDYTTCNKTMFKDVCDLTCKQFTRPVGPPAHRPTGPLGALRVLRAQPGSLQRSTPTQARPPPTRTHPHPHLPRLPARRHCRPPRPYYFLHNPQRKGPGPPAPPPPRPLEAPPPETRCPSDESVAPTRGGSRGVLRGARSTVPRPCSKPRRSSCFEKRFVREWLHPCVRIVIPYYITTNTCTHTHITNVHIHHTSHTSIADRPT